MKVSKFDLLVQLFRLRAECDTLREVIRNTEGEKLLWLQERRMRVYNQMTTTREMVANLNDTQFGCVGLVAGVGDRQQRWLNLFDAIYETK